MEEYLHKTLIDVATPDMTFEELYYYMNDLIVKKGFLTWILLEISDIQYQYS